MSWINSINDLRDCRTIFHLAELLEIEIKSLLFFAYKNEQLYINYKIKKKSGGERIISAPAEALKTISAKINNQLQSIYQESLPKSSHGFVTDRDIVTNARNHISRKYVLNLDLEDFFGTINSGRIIGLFRRYPFFFNKKLASVITGIVTYNNSLPQGAPTSPVLSNMICLKLDRELTRFSESMGWKYSRYADDITISSNILSDKLIQNVSSELIIGSRILAIIKKNGFKINNKKTRLGLPGQSKWVTGIKVNEGLNVSRKLIRQVRAMMHFLEQQKSLDPSSIESFKQNNKRLINIVRGKVSHIGNVKSKNNITYIRLYNRLCLLENKQHKRIPESLKEICMEKTLVIKTSLGFGSGFLINKNIIVTAAHVLSDEERHVEVTNRQKRLPAEFKSASVIHVDREKDLAILYTVTSDFSESIFNVDYGMRTLDFNTKYISAGYGGFRSHGTYWSDVCVLDQNIVQESDNQYRVNNPMWSGMSGGPIISQKNGAVVGYIIKGSLTQESSVDIKSFLFCPISNIPQEFRDINN